MFEEVDLVAYDGKLNPAKLTQKTISTGTMNIAEAGLGTSIQSSMLHTMYGLCGIIILLAAVFLSPTRRGKLTNTVAPFTAVWLLS